MPLGTRIFVALLVLLFGAGVVYYGFIMAPVDRAVALVGDAERLDAAADPAERADPAAGRMSDPIASAASGPIGGSAGRTTPPPITPRDSVPDGRSTGAAAAGPPAMQESRDSVTARTDAARSARPLGTSDPTGVSTRLVAPHRGETSDARSAADRDRSSGGSGDAPRRDRRDDAPAPSPLDPPPAANRAPATDRQTDRPAAAPTRREPSAPVTEAPKANEPLRVRDRAAGSDAAPRLAREILHTVSSGETLSSIAQRYYGSANQWSIIARANPGIDPNRLQIDQQLRIPPVDAHVPERSAAGSSRPNQQAAPAARDVQTYVVQPGDTLSSISIRFYRTANQWSKIHEANRDVIGSDPGRLRVGTTLRIPS